MFSTADPHYTEHSRKGSFSTGIHITFTLVNRSQVTINKRFHLQSHTDRVLQSDEAIADLKTRLSTLNNTRWVLDNANDGTR